MKYITEKNLDIKSFFEITCNDILCNTSYPIRPEFFAQYKTDQDIMKNSHDLSFYFHIPFCKSLCSFCEYTRFMLPNPAVQLDYVKKLKLQALKFIANHKINALYGLDIGGGTPTALSYNALKELLAFIQSIIHTLPLHPDFESSMEFSFSSIDEDKINLIANSGIQRLSSGIQVYDTKIMELFNRFNSSIKKMAQTISIIRRSGIKKINLDLMYGFEAQNRNMLDNSIHVIEELQPDQVTFYEMRYNQNNLNHSSISRDSLFEQYSYLFEKIKSLGYKGDFGQNAFSLFDDYGVSSYIRSRMMDGIPYKGFGISAQSMSHNGLSYNILKSCKSKNMPDFDEIFESDVYLLPEDEITAKYVCIALYCGKFNLNVISEILKNDVFQIFARELNFITENKLAQIDNGICKLTEKGFKVYGGVASLFWSRNHKLLYLDSLP